MNFLRLLFRSRDLFWRHFSATTSLRPSSSYTRSMQTSRPNAVSRRSQLPAGARSTSPLVGDAPRSPLTSTARLAGQLGAMSVNGASKSALSSSPPSKSRPTLSSAYSSHRKSKSVSGPSSSLPSRGGKSSETSSTRTSPVKLQNGRSSSSSSSTHTKTPSRSHAATLLSKSAGPSTSTITARDSLIAAGGLGRMDIVTKDWDGPASSSSAGSSPQKRRPSVTAKVSFTLSLHPFILFLTRVF